MNSVEQMSAARHVYRIKTWLKALYILLGLGFAGMGFLLAYEGFSSGRGGSIGSLAFVFFFAFGAFWVAQALRSRLTIEGTRIEVRGAIREKGADLSEIVGFRTVSSRNGTFTVVQLKEGRGTISIPSTFDTDDCYREWLQKIENLDDRDRKAILAEIEQNQELGATAEERLGALKTAKTWSIVLLVFAVAAAVALNFGDASMWQTSFVALALAPGAAAYLLRRSPLLYALFKRKADPRAELSFVLLVSGFGLVLRGDELHMVSMQPLFAYTALAGLVYLALFFGSAQKQSAKGAILGLVFFAGLYCYGAVTEANAFFDGATGKGYLVRALDKSMSSGRSTTYYLRLAAWGPVEKVGNVSVSGSLYRDVTSGDFVCVVLHPGALHAPWYRVYRCLDAPAPFPSGKVAQ